METILRRPNITFARPYRMITSSRLLHQSFRARSSPLAEAPIFRVNSTPATFKETVAPSSPPALSLLSLPTLLRSYLISAVSSRPVLLRPSLRFLSFLAHTKSSWLHQNRVLYFILRQTFYKQFCAGETPAEVGRTAAGLRDMGFKGVILAYAKEIVIEKGSPLGHAKSDNLEEVETWKEGTLETVRLADRDGFAALKFSGAGPATIQRLIEASPPSTSVTQAAMEICETARSRGVRLLIDAEQSAVQEGIDRWTLNFQQKYNREGGALVYGTYQAYLRSTPATLARHLALAQQEGFTLGVKLVRGAYLASDPRHLIWSTKEESDRAYDGIAESLLRKQWNDILKPAGGATERSAQCPTVDLVLASHNQESVRKAISIRQEQDRRREQGIRLAYAQLMGMADDIGCELLLAGRNACGEAMKGQPQAYKYVVWGTVQECLKYLVRRAEENRDALGRAKHDRNALGRELRRRVIGY